ncbi:hypothetical protein [Streptomyces cyaneofuscatus]|uniref:hypothetical protein n=1 Tax=Streptomyces cyaneofuscatus TaxID=66883 RepID=UPI00365262C8
MNAPARATSWQRLRRRVARLTRALTLTDRRAAEPDAPCAELRRIASDPDYRALFLAELDAAITDRDAERKAVLHAIEAAADRLRCLVVGPGDGSGAGERAA